MTALKEQRCERERPADDDDFGGLSCPPLDDLEAVFILETMTCDPSNFFDDIKLDDDDFGGLPCPPLDDLEAVFILETMICHPSNLSTTSNLMSATWQFWRSPRYHLTAKARIWKPSA
ncbi:hypothetical protein ACE6H2_007427 [Prunus campanulata]